MNDAFQVANKHPVGSNGWGSKQRRFRIVRPLQLSRCELLGPDFSIRA